MKMWIDIEQKLETSGGQIDSYKIGFIITDDSWKTIVEQETNFENAGIIKEILLKTIETYKIKHIHHYAGSDEKIILNILTTNKYEIKFIDISKEIFENQIPKNLEFAKASNVKVEYEKLHSPLYDIQITLKAYINYLKANDDDDKKYIIENSFFQLSPNFRDIHKPVLKNELIFSVVNNCSDLWITNQEELKENTIIFINYSTWEKKSIALTSMEEIVHFYKTNIIISIYNAKNINKNGESLIQNDSSIFNVFETINIGWTLLNKNIEKKILFSSKVLFDENVNCMDKIIKLYECK